jgi:hypothetical protein
MAKFWQCLLQIRTPSRLRLGALFFGVLLASGAAQAGYRVHMSRMKNAKSGKTLTVLTIVPILGESIELVGVDEVAWARVSGETPTAGDRVLLAKILLAEAQRA